MFCKILAAPVLILEDDLVVQLRLKDILESIGYQTHHLLFASNLEQAFIILNQQSLTFAIVDLGLPDGHGQSFIAAMRQKSPHSLILVVSAWSTQDAILVAIQAGATGYVLKERDDFEISLAIRSLLRGGAPIDPFMAQLILKLVVPSMPKTSPATVEKQLLSCRELQILQLVAQGLSNKEIADQLYLSRYTVECHIKQIYRKLSVSSRAKAINTARNIGLLI